MIDLDEYFFLWMKVHELILLEYFLFAHDLQGKDFISASKLDKFDSAESSIAESGKNFQIVAFEFSHDLLTVLLKGIEFVFLHNNKQ